MKLGHGLLTRVGRPPVSPLVVSATAGGGPDRIAVPVGVEIAPPDGVSAAASANDDPIGKRAAQAGGAGAGAYVRAAAAAAAVAATDVGATWPAARQQPSEQPTPPTPPTTISNTVPGVTENVPFASPPIPPLTLYREPPLAPKASKVTAFTPLGRSRCTC